MHFYEVTIIISSLIVGHVQLVEVGREVEGGFEVLNTGPVQLIIPDILSFTINNEAQCHGAFRICYVSDPKASRQELKSKYFNVGGSCPTGYCTLWLMPGQDGVFGLAAERHDGNLYGLLVKGSTSMCPLYVADGLSNFIVINVPDCPVIIDGARLPKVEPVNKPKDKEFDVKWIIVICVGLSLLLLVVGIVGFYNCTRSRKVVRPVKSVRHSASPKSHHKTSPINKQLDGSPHAAIFSSPKTPPSYNERYAATESKLQRTSQEPKMT
uniref:CX domain-containing protein n=1 Tax=Panagrellus redivivus TaxID=6233 RepID=A0A7E4ZRS6_PANRE